MPAGCCTSGASSACRAGPSGLPSSAGPLAAGSHLWRCGSAVPGSRPRRLSGRSRSLTARLPGMLPSRS
eukprot:2491074-Alexandrium_andersonii.AAC.1